MIHVQRLGVAFEACIAGGLDCSPCSASVARKRLRRLSAQLFLTAPAPFEALAADVYALAMPPPPVPVPPGVGMVVQAPANSVPGASALVGQLAGVDGTFLPWADAEPVLFPRFAVVDRAPGSGFDFFFECWKTAFLQGLPAPMAAAFSPFEISKQVCKRFIAHLPDELISTALEPMEARMVHLTAFAGPTSLDSSNAVEFLQHTDVLLSAITTDTPGTEILKMLGEIIMADLGNVPVNLANASLVESHILDMHDRMLRPDAVAMVPSDRVRLLVTEHGTAVERRQAAPTRESDIVQQTSGYARIYDQAMRAKLMSASFLAAAASIETMFARGVHPYLIITAVMRSCEIIFWHALFGRKKALQGVPVVSQIAVQLPPHGPCWLGDLAMRFVLPPLPPGAPALAPPALVDEWDGMCKGNLTLDLETLIVRIKAFAAGPTATFESVPFESRYRSPLRLTEVSKVGVAMYDEFGFPSPAGVTNTPLDMFDISAAYYAESTSLRDEVRKEMVASSLNGIDRERTKVFKEDLAAGDPVRLVGGQYVIGNSASLDTLVKARGELTSTNFLARQLNSLNAQQGIAVHFTAADMLPSSGGRGRGGGRGGRGGGGGGGGGDGDGGDGGGDDVADDKQPKPPKDEKVGDLGHLISYDTNDRETAAVMHIGKKARKESIDLKKFRAHTKTGCAAVWCSRHPSPWLLCDQSKDPKHQSKTGGVHKPSTDFRKTVLATLVIASAADGASLRAPAVAAAQTSIAVARTMVGVHAAPLPPSVQGLGFAPPVEVQPWSTGVAVLGSAFERQAPPLERSAQCPCPPLPHALAASPPPLAEPRDLTVLSLCSGPFDAPSGLPFFLSLFGVSTEQHDVLEGAEHDITERALSSELRARGRAGKYCMVTAGLPCSTCSFSRVLNTHPGPQMVRSAWLPDGLRGLPPRSFRELVKANQIYRTGTDIMLDARRGGASLVTENPSPRHDPWLLGGRLWSRGGVSANHGSYWLTVPARRLTREAHLLQAHFAYCTVDPDVSVQKYTTLGYTPELAPVLGLLHYEVCEHPPGYHEHVGGQDDSGVWRTAAMAPWPRVVNCSIAVALARDLGLVSSDCTVAHVLASAGDGVATPSWPLPAGSPESGSTGVDRATCGGALGAVSSASGGVQAASAVEPSRAHSQAP